MTTPLP